MQDEVLDKHEQTQKLLNKMARYSAVENVKHKLYNNLCVVLYMVSDFDHCVKQAPSLVMTNIKICMVGRGTKVNHMCHSKD